MFLESEAERAQAERARSQWLAREAAILEYLKMTDSIMVWGYWMLRGLLPLVGLIGLIAGCMKGNLLYLLVGAGMLLRGIAVLMRGHDDSYDSARAEVEAAIDAVRRGEPFPPEYTPDTQRRREPLLQHTGSQMIVLTVFLLLCGVLCIGVAALMIGLILMEDGPGLLFWGFSPVYLFFLLFGIPLSAAGVMCAKGVWAFYRQKGV